MVQSQCRGGAMSWTSTADAAGTRDSGCEMVELKSLESAILQLMIPDEEAQLLPR